MLVEKDLQRQKVKCVLEEVDNQVMNMYNKILITKQKLAAENEQAAHNKGTKSPLQEYENDAKKIIDEQIELHRELTELTDFLC